jgi:hypothetical protein
MGNVDSPIRGKLRRIRAEVGDGQAAIAQKHATLRHAILEIEAVAGSAARREGAHVGTVRQDVGAPNA